jgi:hypothetical protein
MLYYFRHDTKILFVLIYFFFKLCLFTLEYIIIYYNVITC